MVIGTDVYGPVAATVALAGAAATWAGIYLSRKSTKEANSVQKEAVDAHKKLDEVDSLQRVVNTLNGEVIRLNRGLKTANNLTDRLNGELEVAQRNVRTLISVCERNGVVIPALEPMHDVN